MADKRILFPPLLSRVRSHLCPSPEQAVRRPWRRLRESCPRRTSCCFPRYLRLSSARLRDMTDDRPIKVYLERTTRGISSRERQSKSEYFSTQGRMFPPLKKNAFQRFALNLCEFVFSCDYFQKKSNVFSIRKLQVLVNKKCINRTEKHRSCSFRRFSLFSSSHFSAKCGFLTPFYE